MKEGRIQSFLYSLMILTVEEREKGRGGRGRERGEREREGRRERELQRKNSQQRGNSTAPAQSYLQLLWSLSCGVVMVNQVITYLLA